MTRITTSPSRVYRERMSPVRIITPSARIYRRDVNSPVRLVTSPGRIVNIRLRPSTLSKEFDRIDRKYRSSPVGVNDTEHYLNSAYALVGFEFDFVETRTLTASLCRNRISMTQPEKFAHPPRDWWRKFTSQSHVPRVSLVTDVLPAFSQATAGKTPSIATFRSRLIFRPTVSTPTWSTSTETLSLRTSTTSTRTSCDQHAELAIISRFCRKSSTPTRQDGTLVSWADYYALTHETLEALLIVLVRDRFRFNSELTADTNFDTQIALNVRWFSFLELL